MSTILMTENEKPKYLERLKKHRVMRGYLQEQIAEVLYMSRAGYGAVERGKRRLSIDSAIKLAGFYGITIDDLVGFGEYDTEGRKHNG